MVIVFMNQIILHCENEPESPIRKNKASRFVCPICKYRISKKRLKTYETN